MSISSTQFFNNLIKIAQEKSIDEDKVVEILKFSLEKAYLKESPDIKLFIDINKKKKEISLFEVKNVVDKKEDDIDDDIEISLDDAKKINSKAKVGEEINIEVNLKNFEKRMASHVLQLFQQKLSEITNLKVFDVWQNKIGSIIRAEVEKVDNKYIEVNLGDTMGVLLKNEQIPNELLEPGKSYLFLIKDIKPQSKSWPIILSRNDKKLLEYLLFSNVSEIQEGIIEIKMIARVPGFKSKVALISHDTNVDPVGTCVGVGGKRIKDISSQLNNEKIDIINYSDDPKQFLVNALSPEKIIGVEITNDEETNSKIITIVCDDKDLAKVIGKSGVNVKLLSQLTGWSIDFVSLTIAIEDKINFQDISNIAPVKFNNSFNNRNFGNRRFNSSSSNPNNNYNNSNNSGRKNNFYNSENKSTWDSFNKQVEEITDEEIENILNFNSSTNTKKKRKININNNDANNMSSNADNVKNKKINILEEYNDVSEEDVNLDDNNDNSYDEDIDYNDNYDEK